MAAKMDVMVELSAVMLAYEYDPVLAMEKLSAADWVLSRAVLMAVRMDTSRAAARAVAWAAAWVAARVVE